MNNAKQLADALRFLNQADTVPVQVAMPREVYAQAREVAKALGLTWNQLITIGVLRALELLKEDERVKTDTIV